MPPALRILYSPRAEIRRIADESPIPWVLFLAAVEGLGWAAVAREQLVDSKVGFPTLGLIPVLILGPPLAVALLYLHAWLIRLTGRWLGGTATLVELRAALAWAAWPTIASRLVQLPLVASELLERGGAPAEEGSSFQAALASACELGNWVDSSGLDRLAGIWSIWLFLACVSTVQRFSVWRTILNDLLGRLLGGAVIGAVVWGLYHSVQ